MLMEDPLTASGAALYYFILFFNLLLKKDNIFDV